MPRSRQLPPATGRPRFRANDVVGALCQGGRPVVAEALRKDEAKIFEEPPSVHGQAIDISGNSHPEEAKVEAPMWPGATPNRVPE